MIHAMDYESNVDMDRIPSILAEWDVEYCMDGPSEIHMK